jgi:hypothetical protein
MVHMLRTPVIIGAWPVCPPSTKRTYASLSSFLDVAADELLCVFFQYRVDLVQKVIHFLGDLLDPLGHLGVYGRRRGLVDLGIAAGLA